MPCDGVTATANAPGCTQYYLDGDGDGYGVDEVACVCGDPEEPYNATNKSVSNRNLSDSPCSLYGVTLTHLGSFTHENDTNVVLLKVKSNSHNATIKLNKLPESYL